jgi:general secretion pathway protein L
MLVAEDQIMFNDGAANEFVVQDLKPSEAVAVSGVLDDEESASAGHLLVYCEPSEEARFEHDWNVLRHELGSVDINLLPDGVLPRLAVTVGANRGINLLQGPYGAKVEYGPMLRPWRTAAALLVGLVLIGFGAKVVDYYRLSAEQDALHAQFTETYRKIRPGDTGEITNPMGIVEQLKRTLGEPVSTGVFLPSLQQLSLALQQNESVEIEAISYRAGLIDVRLTAPDVATLDNIQKLVSTSGRFTASIQSTDQVGDKVSSRIQIRESGA